jgi:hypothetical protein
MNTETLIYEAGQCCENYFRARKVIGDSFSGGDLKERSDTQYDRVKHI